MLDRRVLTIIHRTPTAVLPQPMHTRDTARMKHKARQHISTEINLQTHITLVASHFSSLYKQIPCAAGKICLQVPKPNVTAYFYCCRGTQKTVFWSIFGLFFFLHATVIVLSICHIHARLLLAFS